MKSSEEAVNFVHSCIYQNKFERGRDLNSLEAEFKTLVDECCAPEKPYGVGGDNISAILVELKPHTDTP